MKLPAQSVRPGDIRRDGRRITEVTASVTGAVIIRHDDGTVEGLWPMAQLTIDREASHD